MLLLLFVLVLFLVIDAGLAAFFFVELLDSEKRSPAWWGNLVKAGVLTANLLAFLILYAIYSLHLWN